MHTPGLPVSRPWVAAMKAAACSCRVRTSLILEFRSDSTTSRFSSPGTPKMRSTPSFSSAATRRSEPFFIDMRVIYLFILGGPIELIGPGVHDGRFPARQCRQPCLGSHRDRRLFPRMRTIIQRRHRPLDDCPLNAALDCLGMQSEGLAHRIKRRILSVSHTIRARSTRLAGSVRDCAIDDNSIARRHAAITLDPSSQCPLSHI